MLEELFEPENREKLVTLLAYHVAAGSFDMKQSQVEKSPNWFERNCGRAVIQEILELMTQSLSKAIRCSDGTFTIDTVLIPEVFNSFFNRYGGKQYLR